MKLKKILYTNLLFLMLITNLYSNFNIDLSGVVSGGGDTGTLYGAAYGLSYNFTYQYAFIYKGYYTGSVDERKVSGKNVNLECRQTAQLGGVEFFVPVSFLNENRVIWRNSICAGYSWTEVSANSSSDNKSASDKGSTVLVSTGLGYVLTRHSYPFIDASYYYADYNGLFSNSKIYGWQLNAGVSYSFSGLKSIKDMY